MKRQGAVSAYAFVQFTDIRSVVKVLKEMEGEVWGSMKLKVGIIDPWGWRGGGGLHENQGRSGNGVLKVGIKDSRGGMGQCVYSHIP